MKSCKFIVLIWIMFFSHNVFSAKVYKCKDAEGHTLFSNFRCKGDDASKGLIAETNNKDETVIRKGQGLQNKESDAEKQLHKIQQASDKETLAVQQKKKDKRTAELTKLQLKKERQQLADSKIKAKADCKYNKAKAKYWREKSRDREITKRSKFLYESNQYKYEAKAREC
ncbi:MAG: hypothetical protein COB62_01725 [Piscirickettsiaceae bacterium]|nr:MAG: hypothetical protein COB62_01725 [Piscirickettsiaceae bacterium]